MYQDPQTFGCENMASIFQKHPLLNVPKTKERPEEAGSARCARAKKEMKKRGLIDKNVPL
jgi:hypothetical protein